MPWFWGKKATNDHDEEEEEESEAESYDSEEYTDEEEDDDDEDEEDVEDNHENDHDHDNASVEEKVETEKESAPATATLVMPDLPEVCNAPTETSSPDQQAGEETIAAAAASTMKDSPTTTTTVESNQPDPDVEMELPLKPPAGLHTSQHSHSTDDDNVSLIHSEGLHSGDESYLDTTDDDDDDDDDEDDDDEEEEEEEEEKAKDSTSNVEKANGIHKDSSTLPSSSSQSENTKTTASVQVETVTEEEEDSDGDDEDPDKGHPEEDDNDEEEEAPTSFWEKQSLLALAAEHDRVDILKGILADDDQNTTNELMDSGVPPLHIAISFGSVNATQSLLRMGADPSIRPNVAEIKKQAQEAPEGSKLEIPNMARFDGVTAWELAFGNAAYEEHHRNHHRPSWSMFNGSSSSLSLSSSARTDTADRIIKPVDMPPSKREGIRHAFTAEALRCIGADEVDRLKQLLNSGMPASIEVGGKDLYDWAVQLGGLSCEEYLRPIEAAKFEEEEKEDTAASTNTTTTGLASDTPATPSKTTTATTLAEAPPSVGKVLDRPGEAMTVPLLINRLDELESLATALSTCLDNLAEEVSVCHGLLLLGGGASALAAHVKSLKTLQEQKRTLLFQAQQELDHTEHELEDLVRSSGKIGEEVMALTPTMFLRPEYNRAESFRNHNDDNDDNSADDESPQRQQLLAQIAASENKILKLRASIADLSEENAKEMEQVERRGLTGGINLVRTLREELRDLDYQCSETKNRLATCRAQIGMIHSRLPKQQQQQQQQQDGRPTMTSSNPTDNVTRNNAVIQDDGIILVDSNKNNAGIKANSSNQTSDTARGNMTSTMKKDTATTSVHKSEPSATSTGSKNVDPRPTTATTTTKATTASADTQIKLEPSKLTLDRPVPALPGRAEVKRPTPRAAAVPTTTTTDNNKTDSEKIATGDSQALALRPSGNRGFFTVDLWQVILRIIGLDDAANRRGVRISQRQKGTSANLMIV